MGLPALCLAVHFVINNHQHHPSTPVSVFIISLLLTGFLDLIGSAVVVMSFPSFNRSPCWISSSLLSNFRIFGLLLHQLVALEGVLHLRRPLCASRLSSMPCSLPLTLAALVWVYVIVWLSALPHSCFSSEGLFKTFLVLCCWLIQCIISVTVTLAVCVLTCKAQVFPASTPQTHRRAGRMILSVSMVATFAFYFPSLIFMCMALFKACLYAYISESVWIMFFSITSLRLIADPLLCVLICREVTTRQPLQPEADLHIDLRSV